jgi:hypothetical protein
MLTARFTYSALAMIVGLVGGSLVGRQTGLERMATAAVADSANALPQENAPTPSPTPTPTARSGAEPGCEHALVPSTPPAGYSCGQDQDPSSGPVVKDLPRSGEESSYNTIYRIDGAKVAPSDDSDDSDEALLSLGRYRGRPLEPMGDETDYNGVPMKMFELDVREDVADVEANYVRQFYARGLAVITNDMPQLRGARYLSYRPRHGRRSLTLVLAPAPLGTHVLGSLAETAAFFQKEVAFPNGLPQPDGIEDLVVNEARDGDGVERTVSFQVRERPKTEVEQFLVHGLVERGFSRGSDQGGQLSFSRAGELLTVRVEPLQGLTGGASVHLFWVQP